MKVSLVLISFNQERYIEDAIKSALNQDYSNLEIIISDDASSDSTTRKIESLISSYSGGHKIVLNVNTTNLGLVGNFEKAMSLSSGEIIIAAAGDDISLPYRVAETVNLLNNHPRATFVSFSDHVIDENGVIIYRAKKRRNQVARVVSFHDYMNGLAGHLSGASRGFRRSVANKFGSLLPDSQTEDSTYLLRCLIMGEGVVSEKPGILYRKHTNNLSGAANIGRLNIDRLISQYRLDVRKGVADGLIDTDTEVLIDKWIAKVEARRKMDMFINNANPNFKFFFRNIFLGGLYNRGEQLDYFKKFLKKSIKI
jgi:glycosyltransferase involved in cell wall biosynthesis